MMSGDVLIFNIKTLPVRLPNMDTPAIMNTQTSKVAVKTTWSCHWLTCVGRRGSRGMMEALSRYVL